MTRTSTELEQEFLQDLNRETGKSLEDWLDILRLSKRATRGELLALLKEEFQWSYLPAQLLVGIFLNQGRPVYQTHLEADAEFVNEMKKAKP